MHRAGPSLCRPPHPCCTASHLARQVEGHPVLPFQLGSMLSPALLRQHGVPVVSAMQVGHVVLKSLLS